MVYRRPQAQILATWVKAVVASGMSLEKEKTKRQISVGKDPGLEIGIVDEDRGPDLGHGIDIVIVGTSTDPGHGTGIVTVDAPGPEIEATDPREEVDQEAEAEIGAPRAADLPLQTISAQIHNIMSNSEVTRWMGTTVPRRSLTMRAALLLLLLLLTRMDIMMIKFLTRC